MYKLEFLSNMFIKQHVVNCEFLSSIISRWTLLTSSIFSFHASNIRGVFPIYIKAIDFLVISFPQTLGLAQARKEITFISVIV